MSLLPEPYQLLKWRPRERTQLFRTCLTIQLIEIKILLIRLLDVAIKILDIQLSWNARQVMNKFLVHVMPLYNIWYVYIFHSSYSITNALNWEGESSRLGGVGHAMTVESGCERRESEERTSGMMVKDVG